MALRLAFCLLLAAISMFPSPVSAATRDRPYVPPELATWEKWVLHGMDERLCPSAWNDPDSRTCVWPSRLSISIDRTAGTFTQDLLIFSETWVGVPGDKEHWPGFLSVDGVPAPVLDRDGVPSVLLKPGTHKTSGKFSWGMLPQSLRVPPGSGVVELTVEGKRMDSPEIGPEGRIWFQADKGTSQGDNLDVKVFRLLDDDVPFKVTTLVRLNITGKSREAVLGGILLEQAIPVAVRSTLPARLEQSGKISVQVRPGRYDLWVESRMPGPVLGFASVSAPYGVEVWSFRHHNDIRMVEVLGLTPVDPDQTELPAEWKAYPAFLVEAGSDVRLREIRRGDQELGPDQLSLQRTLWLDFDGGGFSIRDHVTGKMNGRWRLDLAAPAILGRVALNGADQHITEFAGRPGVEIRTEHLDLVAESRLEQSQGSIPAGGWSSSFQNVAGTLNLPPGWRLFTASGVNVTTGTWFERWDLLDFFIVLIVSLAVWRLWGTALGLCALVAVGLGYHEPGAPRMVWVAVLICAALVRFLPEGLIKRVAKLLMIGSLTALIIISIPFFLQQIRTGIYPQLENLQGRMMDSGTMLEQRRTKMAPGMPAPLSSDSARGALKSEVQVLRKDVASIQDPNVVIQTGPGMPDWKWRSIPLQWNGPVEPNQLMRLYLISPLMNKILGLITVLSLALLILGIFSKSRFLFLRKSFWIAVLLAVWVPGLSSPDPVAASAYPPNDLLAQLQERLLISPDCYPACVDIPRMFVSASGDSVRLAMDLYAGTKAAFPLPGDPTVWPPAEVTLDGSPATGLIRGTDRFLWVMVPEGIHSLVLTGRAPAGANLQIPMPVRPKFTKVVDAGGWTIQGIHPDGTTESAIQLSRTRTVGGSWDSAQDTSIPPFVLVTRRIDLGLSWLVHTSVERVAPSRESIVVSVPLLEGESVLSGNIKAESGYVLLTLGPGERQAGWESSLSESDGRNIRLTAPLTTSWTEKWVLDVSPIWHCEKSGIAVVQHHDESGLQGLQWLPFPGESVTLAITRPMGVAGQVMTIDKAKLSWTPGETSEKDELTLSMRSSHGGNLTLKIPQGSELYSVVAAGRNLPIPGGGAAEIVVPVQPGTQNITVGWRHTGAESRTVLSSPKVDLGMKAVNATVSAQFPADRWILWVGGPQLGPAILFWSYLIAALAIALAMSRLRFIPIGTASWLLLAIGLSQVEITVAVVIVGWLIALGLRKDHLSSASPAFYRIAQILLGIWTLAALAGLYLAVSQGLLGIPDMQVAGNGSNGFHLVWTEDRVNSTMPMPWVLSVPLYVYRVLMLTWALWLAISLLGWLRWGWQCAGQGGYWPKSNRGRGEAKADNLPELVFQPEPLDERPPGSAEAPKGGPEKNGS